MEGGAWAARAQAEEVQTAEVQTAEVQTAEVQTAEVQTAEVQTAEVQTAEVQSAEVQTAEVQSAGEVGKGRNRFQLRLTAVAVRTREEQMTTGTIAGAMRNQMRRHSSANLRPEPRCRPWASVLCSASAVAPRSLDGGDLPSSHDEQQVREDLER